MAQQSAAWSCALAALTVLLTAVCYAQADYPGVIELVGYSNRRARTHFEPAAISSPENPTLAPPAAKIRADIETVKRHMKKYDRLLALDTKDLPEPQKDMLARIVERVARLKESLDIEEQQLNKQEATSARNTLSSNGASEEASTITTPTMQMETETDPTLLLDETTLLELQQSMNEQAALQAAVTAQTTLMKEQQVPTTTDMSLDSGNNSEAAEAAETAQTNAAPMSTLSDSLETQTEMEREREREAETEAETEAMSMGTATESEEQTLGSTTSDDALLTDATDPDDQFVAARSNNNIAAITAADADPSSTTTISVGNQRTLTTMGKLKHRATKRPFGHKVTAAAMALKRGQRPATAASAAAAAAAAAAKPSTVSINIGGSTNKQKLGSSSSSNGNGGGGGGGGGNYQQKLQTKPLHKVTMASVNGASSSPATSSSSSGGGGSTVTTPNSQAALPLEQLYTRTPQANIPVAAAAAAAAAAATSASSAAAANVGSGTYGGGSDPMVYDAHVNTSAIIDSLNTNAREEFYQQKQTVNNKDNKKTATAKPTKYHYYPHNQHIYLLPECAIQQVCNAVYVRLNYTQPLCACPSRYRDPCSASLNEDDQHTTKLVGDTKKKAITLAKTCEATTEMRECRSPKDWSLLALQNTRTGKSHYLVICRCPDHFKMEGPMAHDQPTYASVPGIRVFGMMCVKPGYSVRKPSAQPPKRYQLQKPFYRPGSQSTYGGLSSGIINSNGQYGGGSSGGGQKDAYGRPIYSTGGSSAISSNYQPPDQSYAGGGSASSTYQYLNRPESSHTHTHAHNAPNFRPDQFSINNFPGSNYGRNNERRGSGGDAPIEAAGTDDASIGSSTQASDEARTTLQAEFIETAAASAAAGAAASTSSAATSSSELTTPADAQQTQQAEQEPEESHRNKRSAMAMFEEDSDTPEFPWDRVLEFQQTIIWD